MLFVFKIKYNQTYKFKIWLFLKEKISMKCLKIRFCVALLLSVRVAQYAEPGEMVHENTEYQNQQALKYSNQIQDIQKQSAKIQEDHGNAVKATEVNLKNLQKKYQSQIDDAMNKISKMPDSEEKTQKLQELNSIQQEYQQEQAKLSLSGENKFIDSYDANGQHLAKSVNTQNPISEIHTDPKYQLNESGTAYGASMEDRAALQRYMSPKDAAAKMNWFESLIAKIKAIFSGKSSK